MLFLKRSVMYEDESLRGFLTKIATLNRCYQPIDIQKKVEVNKGHNLNNLFMINNKVSLKLCSDRTGILENTLLKGTFNLEIGNFFACDKDINYLKMKGLNCFNTKVCPLCLDEANYFRKIWDVNIVTSCPIHGCLLLDRCFNCNEKISPYSLPLCFCKCGKRLSNFKGDVIVTSKTRMDKFLYEKFMGNENNEENTPLVQLNVFSIIVLIMRIANCLSIYYYNRRLAFQGMNLIEINEVIDQSFEMFCEWPKNFNIFLENLVNDQKRTGFLGVKEIFRNLYKVLYEDINTEPYLFIHQIFEDFLYSNWEKGLLGRNFTKKISSDVNPNFVSGYEAMRRLNVEFRTIQKLVQDKKLEGAISERKNNQIILIKSSSIMEYLISKNEWVNKEEIRKTLGLSHRQTDNLFKHNLIRGKCELNSIGKKSWKYFRVDLDAIIKAFNTNAMDESRTDSHSCIINFNELLLWAHKMRCNISYILKAVMDGKIVPIRNPSSSGVTLNRFLFSIEQLEKYLFQENEIPLSIKKVSTSLGISEYIISVWVKRNYIVANDPYGKRPKIFLHSLENFKNTYITLNEIVLIKAIPTKSIMDDLKELDIKPISYEVIKGYVCCLFLREEVQKYINAYHA